MKKDNCCICGEETELKCRYCENYYCEEHYQKVIMTGNCCSGNEKDYN